MLRPSDHRAPLAPGETFDSFLQRVRSIAPLTAARERMLAARVQRGDRAAKRQLVEANIRLVVCVALRYRNRGFELEDLVQEGTLGLMHAVDKFDPQRGCRLSTYASWWVRLVECCRVRLVQRLGREPLVAGSLDRDRRRRGPATNPPIRSTTCAAAAA